MSGAEGRFRWDVMGKADFARCAGIIASLPQDLRSEMNSSEHGICVRVLHLCWYHAEHSGRGCAFAIPSQGWLGKCIDRCTRTVRRALDWLVAHGLLTSQRRRPIQGEPQTNIYGLGKRLLAVIYASVGQKVQQFRNRTLLSDNNLKKGIEAATKRGGAASSSPTQAKLRDRSADTAPRGAVQPPAAPPQEGEDMANRGQIDRKGPTLTELLGLDKQERKPLVEWEEEKTQSWQDDSHEDDRRAQLKRQAAWLKERGL